MPTVAKRPTRSHPSSPRLCEKCNARLESFKARNAARGVEREFAFVKISFSGRHSLVIEASEDVFMHELSLGVSAHQSFVDKRRDVLVTIRIARSEDS